jgi:hypothetical protein
MLARKQRRRRSSSAGVVCQSISAKLRLSSGGAGNSNPLGHGSTPAEPGQVSAQASASNSGSRSYSAAMSCLTLRPRFRQQPWRVLAALEILLKGERGAPAGHQLDLDPGCDRGPRELRPLASQVLGDAPLQRNPIADDPVGEAGVVLRLRPRVCQVASDCLDVRRSPLSGSHRPDDLVRRRDQGAGAVSVHARGRVVADTHRRRSDTRCWTRRV